LLLSTEDGSLMTFFWSRFDQPKVVETIAEALPQLIRLTDRDSGFSDCHRRLLEFQKQISDFQQ
jgi:hypothetical protein